MYNSKKEAACTILGDTQTKNTPREREFVPHRLSCGSSWRNIPNGPSNGCLEIVTKLAHNLVNWCGGIICLVLLTCVLFQFLLRKRQYFKSFCISCCKKQRNKKEGDQFCHPPVVSRARVLSSFFDDLPP